MKYYVWRLLGTIADLFFAELSECNIIVVGSNNQIFIHVCEDCFGFVALRY
jgi:hypothetical protein